MLLKIDEVHNIKETNIRFDHYVVARSVTERTILPIASNASVDQTRIDSRHCVKIKTILL